MSVFSPLRPPVSRSVFVVPMQCLLVLLWCSLLLAGCSNAKGDEKKGQKKKSAVPVAIAVSTKETLPVEIGATGHVEALSTVEIRSQITGTLKTVHFKEGDDVKAGDPLFTIDPRPFAANLAKAEALLAKNKADLENACREQARYVPAAAKGLVSAEQADQSSTRVTSLAASVQADQAAVDIAKLELEYCSIRAPFAGRTGEILTDLGNLIKANADGPMVTINRIQPILVTFTVPGQYLRDILTYRASGDIEALAVERDASGEPLAGTLVFIDNTVDPTTGVIRLKASFANAERRLWPGQLIDVRLHLTEKPDCVVVPSQAIRVGQDGPYVYVVKEDRTVEYRPVTPGMLYKENTVIDAGLREGERVVTDGQMQLTDGASIEECGPATGKAGADAKETESRATGKRGTP